MSHVDNEPVMCEYLCSVQQVVIVMIIAKQSILFDQFMVRKLRGRSEYLRGCEGRKGEERDSTCYSCDSEEISHLCITFLLFASMSKRR